MNFKRYVAKLLESYEYPPSGRYIALLHVINDLSSLSFSAEILVESAKERYQTLQGRGEDLPTLSEFTRERVDILHGVQSAMKRIGILAHIIDAVPEMKVPCMPDDDKVLLDPKTATSSVSMILMEIGSLLYDKHPDEIFESMIFELESIAVTLGHDPDDIYK